MTSLSFDPVADRYDASRAYPPEVAEAIGAALFAAASAQPGSEILEIGAGTGRIAIPLLALGANVTGVDISPRMLDRLAANLDARKQQEPARGWGLLSSHVADLTALPFNAATFDAVVAVHVLHLVAEWKLALDEAFRVLRPHAPFLIGQDRGLDQAARIIQSRWIAITRELGVPAGQLGAGYRDVVAELRGRGLTIEESIPVTWTTQRTPRQELTFVADRVWSRTWRVPADAFAESIRRLQTWVDEQFGDTLDTPRDEVAEFVLARVVKPG
ncbi:MAG TPA: class I SAM-dependent methyltransferase [Ktedonobacterales bacterium]